MASCGVVGAATVGAVGVLGVLDAHDPTPTGGFCVLPTVGGVEPPQELGLVSPELLFWDAMFLNTLLIEDTWNHYIGS